MPLDRADDEGGTEAGRRAWMARRPVVNGPRTPGQRARPWQFLYFFSLPQGQGSLRPTAA